MDEVIRHELALALSKYVYGRGQEGWPDLCWKLDKYIDARIAEALDAKRASATIYAYADQVCWNVAREVDRPIVGPTAREVHEAWRRWNAHPFTIEYLGNGRYERVRSVPPPSFPELET